MAPDYYRILGVDPAADAAAINRAFRRKALECHPDRGGSHEAMILVIEAWEVLSNPDLRRQYDRSRAGIDDAWPADAARAARAAAEGYPRKWADMERWLDRVAADFTGARYGAERLFGEVSIPTVDGSASGCLFLAAGAVLAGVFVSPAVDEFVRTRIRQQGIRLILVVAPVVGGAWAGAWAHQGIKAALEEWAKLAAKPPPAPGAPPPAPPESSVVVACPACGQKLRVPATAAELVVTCRSCGGKFAHPPPGQVPGG